MSAAGRLCVSVIEARNVLLSCDSSVDPSFYIKLRLGPCEVKTDTSYSSLAPKFMRDVRLTVPSPETDVLRIEMLQIGSKGDLVVGSAEVRIISLVNRGTTVQWLDLRQFNQRSGNCPQVCCVMRYLSGTRSVTPSYEIVAREARERSSISGDSTPFAPFAPGAQDPAAHAAAVLQSPGPNAARNLFSDDGDGLNKKLYTPPPVPKIASAAAEISEMVATPTYGSGTASDFEAKEKVAPQSELSFAPYTPDAKAVVNVAVEDTVIDSKPTSTVVSRAPSVAALPVQAAVISPAPSTVVSRAPSVAALPASSVISPSPSTVVSRAPSRAPSSLTQAPSVSVSRALSAAPAAIPPVAAAESLDHPMAIAISTGDLSPATTLPTLPSPSTAGISSVAATPKLIQPAAPASTKKQAGGQLPLPLAIASGVIMGVLVFLAKRNGLLATKAAPISFLDYDQDALCLVGSCFNRESYESYRKKRGAVDSERSQYSNL